MLTAARTAKLGFSRLALRTICSSCKVMAEAPQLRPGQTWYNELGSKMVITSFDDETGVFTGTYKSPVGEAEKTYLLTGRKDTAGNTLGWTVNWQNVNLNANSVTTWSGQLQEDESQESSILTTWLLTSQTTPDDNWESTQMGFDYFTQNPPSAETGKAKYRYRPSHPREA